MEAGRFLGISNLAGAGAGAIGTYIGGPIADFFTVNVPQMPGWAIHCVCDLWRPCLALDDPADK
jgi:hypothetical protein